MPASKQHPKGNYLRKRWRITGKPWISSAAYRETSGNACHDGYQIKQIPHNAYHGQYEIGGILPESVSLYTLNRQFNSSITQCTHISRIGASSMALYHRTTVKTRKKLRFRWQASQKCTFLLLSGVPEPHMPPAGGERSSSDRYPMRFKFSNTAKEELPSKQNTICTLK